MSCMSEPADAKNRGRIASHVDTCVNESAAGDPGVTCYLSCDWRAEGSSGLLPTDLGLFKSCVESS